MPTVFDHFSVLKPDLLLDQLKVSSDIYQKLDERYNGFRSYTLISAHEFNEDWPTWEKHPAGDEMVVLLSGRAEFILRRHSGDETIELEETGSYVIVPQDTWHTARIGEATSMLFITPGEGTQNEISPQVGAWIGAQEARMQSKPISAADVAAERGQTKYPEPFSRQVAGRTKRKVALLTGRATPPLPAASVHQQQRTDPRQTVSPTTGKRPPHRSMNRCRQ